MSNQEGAPRVSSTSSQRSTGHRSQTSQAQISTIEKSVTHLLVATKQLLEILTAWSRQEATEVNVSDVYVRLGYEFNIACRAFNTIGVDTSDLGPVPDLLRNILEDTLSNEPSQASLEQYLPRIRDIIVSLLQGLKKKQQRLRQRGGREGSIASVSDRPSSSASNHVIAEGASSRTNSVRSNRESVNNDVSGSKVVELPPRMSSAPVMQSTASMLHERMSPQRTGSSRQVTAQPSFTTAPQETAAAPAIQYTEPTTTPVSYESNRPTTPVHESPTPRPRPQQQDALAALQRGGELERRASRRFSTYQIQKHLGSTSSSISVMPPAQHSPIPNRGRDTKDIMNAVRVRGSPASRSQNRFSTNSPSRQGGRVDRETPSLQHSTIPNFPIGVDQEPLDSPLVKTPEDKIRSSYIEEKDIRPTNTNSALMNADEQSSAQGQSIRRSIHKTSTANTTAEASSAGKSLTLFLQYKTKVRKVVLADGFEELSIPRLQLAFIDKFAWNTHSNGIELPDIYIQDPLSGVRYELEDLQDIKDQSVLALNVDALDDVKQHVDHGMDSLKSLLEGLRVAITDQHSVLQQVSNTQNSAAKDIARVAATPSAATSSSLSRGVTDRLDEVQSLRRDLAVMRQTYTSLSTSIESSMAAVRVKAAAVTSAAANASIPAFDTSSGRSYVNAGKKILSDDSEKILTRVEDLQDTVEDLRKDVVSRGVRPLPRQLETVSRDISAATIELKKLQEYIKREKPVWTKIWRNELQGVYEDQNDLNDQEGLAADLEDDLEKAAQTFALVEEATKQQNLEKGGSGGTPTRTVSRTMLNPINTKIGNTDVDPNKAKDGVLGEVRALQPNHESRLEAIERAEKARQRELEDRKEGAFKKELGSFVDEGKLKKSGGFEEAERLRKSKDERLRRGVFDSMAAKGGVMPAPEIDTKQQSGMQPSGQTRPSDTTSLASQAHDDQTQALTSSPPSAQMDTAPSTPTAEIPPPLPLSPQRASNPSSMSSPLDATSPVTTATANAAINDVARSASALRQSMQDAADLPSPVEEYGHGARTLDDIAMSPLPIAESERYGEIRPGQYMGGAIKGTTEEAISGARLPGDFPAE